MKPQYPHDCDNCHFLGNSKEFDLYVCGGGDDPVHTTLIARYGDDGDYKSGLPFIEFDKEIRLAGIFAIARGLLDPNTHPGGCGQTTVMNAIKHYKGR